VGGGLFCCKSQFIPSLHMSRGLPASHLLNAFRAVEIERWFDSVIFVYVQTLDQSRERKILPFATKIVRLEGKEEILLHFEEFRFLRSLGEGAGGRPSEGE
jgi:hypothetical protein